VARRLGRLESPRQGLDIHRIRITIPTIMERYSRLLWVVFAAAFLFALAVTVIPVWLIQPFRAQTPAGVRAAYSFRAAAPEITLMAAVVLFGVSMLLWRRITNWKRTAIVFCFLLTLGCTWFAFQNHFEWMFRPLPNPSYSRAGQASFLKTDDMVLAVNLNGDSVAYPVRQLAYHHLVQDTVGGQPIIATY
jgi:hypothetical protein